jgi:hypothetical protein
VGRTVLDEAGEELLLLEVLVVLLEVLLGTSATDRLLRCRLSESLVADLGRSHHLEGDELNLMSLDFFPS